MTAESEEAGSAKTLDSALQRVLRRLGDARRITILGGPVLQSAATEELVKAIAGALMSLKGFSCAFLTTGMPGVQKAFARHCDAAGGTIFNILPVGSDSGYGIGEDLHGGSDLAARRELFQRLAEVCVVFEGGPSVAEEARTAATRGAHVVPLIRTGGAAAGRFGFPAAALERPLHATEAQWAAVCGPEEPAEEAAAAVASIVAGFLAQGARGEKPGAAGAD